MSWVYTMNLRPHKFLCPYCEHNVSSVTGYIDSSVEDYEFEDYAVARIRICPSCNKPTFFDSNGISVPGISYGENVNNVPLEINSLYNEARKCFSVGSYTAVLMLCRKLIMNVSVDNGAEPNKTFQFYVNYLDVENYIPKNSKAWVDKIRNKGNEATHEIPNSNKEDAKEMIKFTSVLLKLLYEFQE